MVEKHVCVCSPASDVSTGNVSPKYCRCNTTSESDKKTEMTTEEIKPPISKSQQKKIDANEYNAARSIRLTKALAPARGVKILANHPYYAAKIIEMLAAQVKMEEDVRKYIVKGEEGSEAAAEIEEIITKTITLGKRKIENIYKKHYGRSKYFPH